MLVRYATLSLVVLFGARSPGGEQVPSDSPEVVVSPHPEKLETFLVEYQRALYGPLVDHCVDAVPDIGEPMRREYSRVSGDFAKSTRSFLMKGGFPKNGHVYFSPEARAEFQRAAEVMVQRATARDPATYCPTLLESLRQTTPATLVATLSRAFGARVPLEKSKTANPP